MAVKKVAAKAVKTKSENWLVLGSSCGKMNQMEFVSQHTTEKAAQVAALEAGKKISDYYNNNALKYKSVIVAKKLGSVTAVTATTYKNS